MALKTLELRARRDAFVVFFLGFFLILTHFLYSQTLPVAVAMLVSVWGLMTALVLAHMPALDLQEAVMEAADTADVVVMAAAVADFRPRDYQGTKIKKSHDAGDPDAAPTIELVRNPDVLAGLVAARGEDASPVIVGFAAETGDDEASVLEHGRAKLDRKGCDLLVVNEVGESKTFGEDQNTVHILRQGSSHVVDAGPASKQDIAAAVWDAVQAIL